MSEDKFVIKNETNIEEMKSILHNNKVRYIVTSIELNTMLDGMNIVSKLTKLINPYMPANQVDIIIDGNIVHTVRFDIPCICGIYDDEKHP